MHLNVSVAVLADDGSVVWSFGHSESVVVSDPGKEQAPDVEGAALRTAQKTLDYIDAARESIASQIAVDLPTLAAAQRDAEDRA